ncbi:MAG: endonuclease V, partial [Calditerrivibrio sp.]|nr:endonuclease V [Calditerrivibrio sp.]
MSIFSKLKEEQLLLSKMVSLVPLGKKVFTAAGIDVAFDMSRGSGFCVIVVIDSTFEVVEVVNHIDRVDFPYIPGFLSFRELP